MLTGYENGVSTIIGTADASSDRLFLERLPVTSADDGAFFNAKLQGGYGWLHSIQFATKRLRSITAYAMDLLEYDQDSNRRCFPK